MSLSADIFHPASPTDRPAARTTLIPSHASSFLIIKNQQSPPRKRSR